MKPIRLTVAPYRVGSDVIHITAVNKGDLCTTNIFDKAGRVSLISADTDTNPRWIGTQSGYKEFVRSTLNDIRSRYNLISGMVMCPDYKGHIPIPSDIRGSYYYEIYPNGMVFLMDSNRNNCGNNYTKEAPMDSIRTSITKVLMGNKLSTAEADILAGKVMEVMGVEPKEVEPEPTADYDITYTIGGHIRFTGVTVTHVNAKMKELRASSQIASHPVRELIAGLSGKDIAIKSTVRS